LDHKIVQLMNAPQTEELIVYRRYEDAIRPTTKMEVEYLAGVAIALKSNDDVQTAITENHTGFLEENPTYAAIAAQYRDQVIELLEY